MSANPHLSIIVPVYFEEECIDQFIEETTALVTERGYDYEIIFVDDGSGDLTVPKIQQHCRSNQRLKLVELARNHGKQWALSAGIEFARGEVLIMMDPDLQDPPTEIPRFIAKLAEGYDLVFGIRSEKKDTRLNVLLSKLFWWTLRKFTALNLPSNLAVMRIFNRAFADRFLEFTESSRFIEGLFMLVGMRQTSLEITQRKRFAGRTKFGLAAKTKLALDAIFDFSEIPLRFLIKFGFLIIVLSTGGILTIGGLKLFVIDFQAGWPSVISLLTLGFGTLLFFLGIIAIYIGKIYADVKRRPLYSLKQTTNI